MGSRGLIFFLLFLILAPACVEPYEFVVENKGPALVVEGFLSDVSYNESVAFPSDGRYFSISLRYAGDVVNGKDLAVPTAAVSLRSESGEQWKYTESSSEAGKYELQVADFEAVLGKAYKLRIELPNEEIYESNWERLPMPQLAPMGAINFEEVERQEYVMLAGVKEVRTVKGINVYINLPENVSGSPAFYRWKFSPTWTYSAPLADEGDTYYKCWATSSNYLSEYALQEDNTGGYRKPLFFIETIKNERIFERFSLLVTQQIMSEEFFYFWKEMKERAEGEALLDTPPYNLQTNLQAITGKRRVSGYFGVVQEQASRWYFSKAELSYWVENTLRADCEVKYGPPWDPPAADCFNCEDYINGKASILAPAWWR